MKYNKKLEICQEDKAKGQPV